MFYPISRGSVALSQRTNSTEMSNKYALGIFQCYICILLCLDYGTSTCIFIIHSTCMLHLVCFIFLFKGSDGADIVTSGKYWLHQNKKIMEMIAPFSLTWAGNKYAEWLEVSLTQAFSVRSLQIVRRSMFLNYGIVFIL